MKQIKILVLIAIVFTSCNLFKSARAPKYDSYAAEVVQTISYQQNSMWERMKTANASYDANVASEDSIIDNLQVLVTYDSLRKNGTAIFTITKYWLDRVKSIKDEHKAYGNLNLYQIQSYQNSTNNIANIVFKTELNYKP
jgi:hypothetical protein